MDLLQPLKMPQYDCLAASCILPAAACLGSPSYSMQSYTVTSHSLFSCPSPSSPMLWCARSELSDGALMGGEGNTTGQPEVGVHVYQMKCLHSSQLGWMELAWTAGGLWEAVGAHQGVDIMKAVCCKRKHPPPPVIATPLSKLQRA